MSLRSIKWPISCIAGILILVVGWIYISISISLFPGSFSPLNNYVSDLGNYSLNPRGALIYNIGMIIGGVFMFIYFLFLYIFYPENNRGRTLLSLTRVFGFLSSFAIIMVAIYSEDFWTAHVFWSAVLFVLLFLINITGGLFFLNHPDSMRKIGYFNLLVAAFHVSYLFILDPNFIILEWINTILGHVSMALAVYNYKQMFDKKS
ncbi:MAG: DUF998 domain-containing protein [Promethearchaeota archaeon]|nr:MAG: DUF998 domain-containing protein [Candidatus Lokiarchaeota archaeon]